MSRLQQLFGNLRELHVNHNKPSLFLGREMQDISGFFKHPFPLWEAAHLCQPILLSQGQQS